MHSFHINANVHTRVQACKTLLMNKTLHLTKHFSLSQTIKTRGNYKNANTLSA